MALQRTRTIIIQILKKIGRMDYLKNFEDQEVYDHILETLSTGDWKELLPIIGVRNEFIQQYNQWTASTEEPPKKKRKLSTNTNNNTNNKQPQMSPAPPALPKPHNHHTMLSVSFQNSAVHSQDQRHIPSHHNNNKYNHNRRSVFYNDLPHTVEGEPDIDNEGHELKSQNITKMKVNGKNESKDKQHASNSNSNNDQKSGDNGYANIGNIGNNPMINNKIGNNCMINNKIDTLDFKQYFNDTYFKELEELSQDQKDLLRYALVYGRGKVLTASQVYTLSFNTTIKDVVNELYSHGQGDSLKGLIREILKSDEARRKCFDDLGYDNMPLRERLSFLNDDGRSSPITMTMEMLLSAIIAGARDLRYKKPIIQWLGKLSINHLYGYYNYKIRAEDFGDLEPIYSNDIGKMKQELGSVSDACNKVFKWNGYRSDVNLRQMYLDCIKEYINMNMGMFNNYHAYTTRYQCKCCYLWVNKCNDIQTQIKQLINKLQLECGQKLKMRKFVQKK
eukprot:101942_1